MQLVWYHIRSDKIFMSAFLDAAFLHLLPLKWDEIELIGEL